MSFYKRIYKYKFFIAFIVFFVFAYILQLNLKLDPYETERIAEFQKILDSKIIETDRCLSFVSEKLDSLQGYDLMMNMPALVDQLHLNSGIIILGYKNDSLIFWTDNSIPVGNKSVDSGFYNNVVKLKNGWYIVRTVKKGDYKVFGLIHLKNEYSYENKFIQNNFRSEYKILKNTEIEIDPDRGAQLFNTEGQYLFSIVNESGKNINYVNAGLSTLFYLLGIVMVLLIVWEKLKRIKKESARNTSLLYLATGLFLLRFFMLQVNEPIVFKQLELFKPHLFAISSMVPSLGDLMIHTVFAFFFFLVFYKYFSIDLSRYSKKLIHFLLLLFLIAIIAWFFIVNYFFRSLILHSSISFYIHQFLNLSPYTFVGFLIIILLISTVFLTIDRIAILFKEYVSFKEFMQRSLPLFVAICFIIHFFIYKIDFVPFLFFVIVLTTIFFLRSKQKTPGYSIMIIVLLLLSLYSVYCITEASKIKSKEARKVLVVNLANEHDQVAEMLLESISKQIEADTVIRDLLTWYYQNEGAIIDHLDMNYFGSYFIKYDLQISVCNPADNLTLILDNSTDIVHCYTYFDNVFKNDGSKTKGSNFYFLDNLNGRISYLGKFTYKKGDWDSEVSLFISLDSKLVSKELGYPELLLDKRLAGSGVLSDYSYAKYRDGNLITRAGNFSYQLIMPEDWISVNEFFFVSDSKFDHLVYRIDDKTQIVISNGSLGFVNLLASFSYIFVLYYLLITVVFFILKFPGNIKTFRYDFKNKIKVSMIGVLLLSLVIVGFGTVYYNINQFESRLYESVSEKTQSILVEMEHKLGGEIDLNDNYSDYLTYLLTKFSNVFFIDVNLYDIMVIYLHHHDPKFLKKD